MDRKEDARVIRTRQKLFDSFRELLAKKPFEEITINEICIRSDVRRATFYKHFSDKYDFLAGLTRHLRDTFEAKFSKTKDLDKRHLSQYYLEYFKAIVGFVDANRDIVNLILDSNVSSTLLSVIVDENYAKTKERLDVDTTNGLKLVASTDTVAIYLAGGICHAIINWLKKGTHPSKEDFISDMNSLISAVFVK